MKTLEKNITKTKIFFDSDLEMFEELDRTEQRINLWDVKYISIEELYKDNKNFIKNLTI